jgi:DNA-3-methyladenine glycosylase II
MATPTGQQKTSMILAKDRGRAVLNPDLAAIYNKAQRHLSRRDPVLRDIIEIVGPCRLWHNPDGFAALTRSILAQQISTRAAASILARLERRVARRGLNPDTILAMRTTSLRQVGLSAAKARALKDLAAKVRDGTVPLDRLAELPDEEVITRLLPVHGIGRWTAEMFLIFSLGRLDIMPVGDNGLRAGVQRRYQLQQPPQKEELLRLSEPWRPFRTVGTWYIWRSLGFVPQSDA